MDRLPGQRLPGFADVQPGNHDTQFQFVPTKPGDGATPATPPGTLYVLNKSNQLIAIPINEKGVPDFDHASITNAGPAKMVNGHPVQTSQPLLSGGADSPAAQNKDAIIAALGKVQGVQVPKPEDLLRQPGTQPAPHVEGQPASTPGAKPPRIGALIEEINSQGGFGKPPASGNIKMLKEYGIGGAGANAHEPQIGNQQKSSAALTTGQAGAIQKTGASFNRPAGLGSPS